MENKSSGYKIQEKGLLGEVKIADEVIAIIAGLAATEVKGVAGMCGNITNELVSVDLAIELDYGVSIAQISKKVQEKVKTAIENMTGLTIDEVNVRIAGVALEEE